MRGVWSSSFAVALIGAIVAVACSTSYAGVFTLVPPSASEPAGSRAADTVADVVSRVARSYGMEPVDLPAGQREALKGRLDYDTLAFFVRRSESAGGRALHVSALRPHDEGELRVTIRDLGSESATREVLRLQRDLRSELQRRLPGFEIQFESHEVDAWFAP